MHQRSPAAHRTATRRWRRTAALAVGLGHGLLAFASHANPLPDDPLQRRCWAERTAQRTAVDLRTPTAVRFANLRHGDVLRSPFWVEFGCAAWA